MAAALGGLGNYYVGNRVTTKEDIWQGWTDRYVDTENPIPLFETDENLTVEYKNYGKDDRRILK